MILMSGKDCSNYIKEEIKKELNNINNKLKLVVIRVGEDAASKVYINSKKKACESFNIDFEEIVYPDNITDDILINKINELNNDTKVTGILLQLPIPNHLNKDKIINTIDYKKDVDGLTTINIGKLNNNEKSIIPCTALGIINMLKYYEVNLEGSNVVIVGRSNLVGKPLIPLLLKNNATVTVCHSKTKDLKSHLLNADIIICAVGKKHLITKDMVNSGAVIIDVGINRIDGKLYGDVDFDNVKDIASKITPVPGGVGVMTVTSLISNIIECYKLQM